MTDQQLDGLLYRVDTCPKTVTAEDARAAILACETRGWSVPDSLRVVLVTRLLLQVEDAA